MHLAVSIGSLWIPLAAEFTTTNVADSDLAPRLFPQLPAEVRYILGDQHYNPPELRAECGRQNRELVATRRGTYPQTDGGGEVRRVFHQLRSQAIEPFNELFKNLFEWGGQMLSGVGFLWKEKTRRHSRESGNLEKRPSMLEKTPGCPPARA